MQNNSNKIGTRVIELADTTRSEKLGKGTGARIVTARLYYPATVKGEKRVELPGKAVGEMYDGAEMLSEKLPLIIYNHGYNTYVEANNSLCCQLAAEGFFVVSVGHAYEARELTLLDGTQIFADRSIGKRMTQPRVRGTLASLRVQKKKGSAEEMYDCFYEFQTKYCQFMQERLEEWAKDVQAVVALLKQDYADHIAFEQGIGLMGHSFGGNLAYYMCMHYEEYVCGANMDGSIFGQYAGMRMKRPFLQICNPINVPMVSKVLLDTDAPVEYEIMEGVGHLGFTDMACFSRSKLMGSRPYEETAQKLFQLHLKFFCKYLKKSA